MCVSLNHFRTRHFFPPTLFKPSGGRLKKFSCKDRVREVDMESERERRVRRENTGTGIFFFAFRRRHFPGERKTRRGLRKENETGRNDEETTLKYGRNR